ncbi:hypothetical protein NDU88_003056 [Pleurodeles waltl]|uniref:Uncharacterized protein n=1 Tax=Pleurodeles waltl TaxID=8319 RepID=A0AAV7W3X0_PLEWA|nr:hypothetical protein NDU88_003056 [Pleurodeles waltl]
MDPLLTQELPTQWVLWHSKKGLHGATISALAFWFVGAQWRAVVYRASVSGSKTLGDKVDNITNSLTIVCEDLPEIKGYITKREWKSVAGLQNDATERNFGLGEVMLLVAEIKLLGDRTGIHRLMLP